MFVARWRVLKGVMNYSVWRSTEIVSLLMKLHNFCIKYDGPGSEKDGLTLQEREELEEDVRIWYQQSEELVEEFNRSVCIRASTNQPSRSTSALVRNVILSWLFLRKRIDVCQNLYL